MASPLPAKYGSLIHLYIAASMVLEYSSFQQFKYTKV